jgi:hypothetical protein
VNKFKFSCLLVIVLVSVTAVKAQQPQADIAISLERTACRGICPVYAVTILEDGTVHYTGEDFVAVTGEQTTEIDPTVVDQMVEAFATAGYFGWNQIYSTQTVSDLATIITSVTRDGETHRTERYVGDYSAPLALPFLENWIDEMIHSQLWTGVQPDPGAISNGTDTARITLQRNACFGPCAVDSAALFADGTVVYTGIANVDRIGVHIFQVDSTAVEGIVQQAQLFGYFGWMDSYEERVRTDQATVITLVRWEDQFKRIVRYDGDPHAPVGLIWLEESIAQLVTDGSDVN